MGEYYGNNDWRDYLAHYGVKGMKWRKHKKRDLNDALGDVVSRISNNAEYKKKATSLKLRKLSTRNKILGWKNKVLDLKRLSSNLDTIKTPVIDRSKKVNNRRVSSLILKTSNATKLKKHIRKEKRKRRTVA